MEGRDLDDITMDLMTGALSEFILLTALSQARTADFPLGLVEAIAAIYERMVGETAGG